MCRVTKSSTVTGPEADRARSHFSIKMIALECERTATSSRSQLNPAGEDLLMARSAGAQDSRKTVDWQRGPLRKSLFEFTLVFLLSYLILFLGMSRRPNMYDEGISLTGAMQVLAGQLPHRDFYSIYGPGQFYMLAVLFKIFGQSLLVARLFDLLIKAILALFVYAIASRYCRRPVAVATYVVTMLWLTGIYCPVDTAVVPVSLLDLIALALILPVFVRKVSNVAMVVAGAAAGLAALFRYDIGVALLGMQACVIASAIFLRRKPAKLRNFAAWWGPCLLGFVLLTLPFALHYLSVGALDSIIYDVILYPARYYHAGRNLPFPGISLKFLENLEDYLPIAVIGISVYAVIRFHLRAGSQTASGVQNRSQELRLQGFLITFSLLAFAMYCKAFVRMDVGQLYLCIPPLLLLTAVLFEQRWILPRPLQIATMGVAALSVLTAAWSVLHQERRLQVYHLSVPERMWTSLKGTSSPAENAWCKSSNPVTSGFCFLPEDYRVQTIEFIAEHTKPGQLIYVGLAKHDRIFANDDLTYFATQRLPATKWSHFDPDLQSRYDIQTEIVHELEAKRPEYVVLDAEFEQLQEPNDSSKSSGVTLLDDYLQSKYQPAQTFGLMSVWRRIQ